ncbi:hypothetical protein K443DRAFT_170962 [Laccaria amethystina LaAM-08-1]|uniref:Uncharacterized protein n=1 Tax=Laccaria amethystina LaAM-08-1 TaxID=1095629 RepID=A0A0C9XDD7_9AGAR|nr:hypothetical protein K443DRAFT_170962 [Laccaria amethystina LaAM-08-1]
MHPPRILEHSQTKTLNLQSITARGELRARLDMQGCLSAMPVKHPKLSHTEKYERRFHKNIARLQCRCDTRFYNLSSSAIFLWIKGQPRGLTKTVKTLLTT